MANKMKGSALVSALFIMTLIAIIAIAMSEKIMIEIYRLRVLGASTALYQEAELGPYWAMSFLKKTRSPLKRIDDNGLIGIMPPKNKSLLRPSTHIEVKLYDLQAKININNIESPTWQPVLSRLFKQQKKTHNKKLIKTLIQWIGPYRPGNAQELLKGKLLPAFQPLTDLSELLLVPGFSTQQYKTLIKNLVALPTQTPININTAPLSILKKLSRHTGHREWENIDHIREASPIKNLNQIKSNLMRLNVPISFLTTESQYFLVHTHIYDDHMTLDTYTHLRKTVRNKNQVKVYLMNQRVNTPPYIF